MDRQYPSVSACWPSACWPHTKFHSPTCYPPSRTGAVCKKNLYIGVTTPSANLETSNYGNSGGVFWYAEDGTVRGGQKGSSPRHSRKSRHACLVSGSCVTVDVVFDASNTATVSIFHNGSPRGVLCVGLPGPLCASCFFAYSTEVTLNKIK